MSLTIWKGNTLPLLTDTLSVDGSPFNLTGATVTFSMRPTDAATLKINGATATVTDAPNGAVSYAWASTDVDTVGNFYAWWTYNYLGKKQDSPEFTISVQEHTPTLIQVPNPVASDGTTTIYKGDAYLNSFNRALVYELGPQNAPDLTAASAVTFRVEGEFHTTGTAIDKSSCRFDLSSSQTAINSGSYRFQVESLLTTGSTAVLYRGTLVVLDQLLSP